MACFARFSLTKASTSKSAPQAYAPTPKRRSPKEHHLVLPSLHTRQTQSRLSFVALWGWIELPRVTRAAESLSVFKKLKAHLFRDGSPDGSS